MEYDVLGYGMTKQDLQVLMISQEKVTDGCSSM